MADDYGHLNKHNGAVLLTQFNELRDDVEVLALKTLYDIQIPVCGVLRQLPLKDCFKLIKYELDQSLNTNQSSEERIFLSYLVTDYISCGLSSPDFYPEFYKYIHPNKSKVKLVKKVFKMWDCLLKNYKITNLNAKFLKNFVVSLANLFVKISNLVPDYKIILRWNKIIDKFKLNIKMYEQSILSSQQHFEQISNNEMQLKNSIEKDLGIENIIPIKMNESKMNFSVQSYVDQNSKLKNLNTEILTLDNESIKLLQINQQCNFENLIDLKINHSQSKKPKLSHDEANIKSDPNTAKTNQILPPEQKLNVFQVMMLNARKQKQNK